MGKIHKPEILEFAILVRVLEDSWHGFLAGIFEDAEVSSMSVKFL